MTLTPGARQRCTPPPLFLRRSPLRLGAALAITIGLAISTGTPASAQTETPDASERVQRIVERYGHGDLAQAWAGCRQLEELGDEIITWAENTLVEGEPIPTLMAAKSLTAIGAVEKPERLERALRRLAQADDNPLPVRSAAIELLGEYGSPATIRLLERLLEGEAAFDADLRIQAAKALFRSANDYRAARNSLLPLLEVDDPTVRAKAAIALGEMGYADGQARRVLLSLEKEPTELGAQARLVLQQDLLMRRLERMRDREAGTDDSSREARRIKELELALEKKDRTLEAALEKLDEVQGPTTQLAQPLITELLSRIEKLYVDPDRVDARDLLVAAAKGMVASLDPFSSFMDVADVEEFEEGISGAYAGIGAQVAKDPETDYLKILRPIYKGPAYEAGLLTDDKIVEVAGFETKGVPLTEIVKRLKGEAGTPVDLKILRRGWIEAKRYEIERRTIMLDSVVYTLLPGSIGYVALSQFGDTAVPEVTRALDDLEQRGMKSLILDLRNNPGGYLDAATKIVDMFVGEMPDPIVTQKDERQNFQVVTTMSTAPHRVLPGVEGDFPLVVLINESSASASEIVSGALQDFHRATIVGTKSYGKGSVQRLLDLGPVLREKLGGESRLRLTVQYYYLPSGRSIHTQRDKEGRVTHEGGVTPDIPQEVEEIPLWRIASLEALLEHSAFERYVAKYFGEHEQTFEQIAEHGDGGRTDAYPDFGEFFGKLNTEHADPDDIRRAVRLKIRRIVQDRRGKEFACDYPEDVQLQRAIAVILEKMGATGEEIAEYRTLLTKFGTKKL
ncbi:MAG: HEAT repeat domain-containing protein [Planctomycetes bacterium]|nr:HEAT repeat domain-containing protein [Planctomycetota bacterium]